MGHGGKERYPLKPRSRKFPPLNLCPKVDLFVKFVTKDLKNISHPIPIDNLTKPQRDALNELKQMKNIVLKPADKGDNVVLWPKHT